MSLTVPERKGPGQSLAREMKSAGEWLLVMLLLTGLLRLWAEHKEK
jgi:hypothetical protein